MKNKSLKVTHKDGDIVIEGVLLRDGEDYGGYKICLNGVTWAEGPLPTYLYGDQDQLIGLTEVKKNSGELISTTKLLPEDYKNKKDDWKDVRSLLKRLIKEGHMSASLNGHIVERGGNIIKEARTTSISINLLPPEKDNDT